METNSQRKVEVQTQQRSTVLWHVDAQSAMSHTVINHLIFISWFSHKRGVYEVILPYPVKIWVRTGRTDDCHKMCLTRLGGQAC